VIFIRLWAGKHRKQLCKISQPTKKERTMPATQNQTAFRRVIAEAFNKGNYQVLPECFNPNFIEHQFGLHPSLRGMESDISFLRAAFPDFNLTIEDMVADGDKVWARMTGRGTNLGGFMGSPNGKSFEITVFDTCRFEDGKIIEHWGSPDRFALLAQLGLLPSAGISPA
jgi:predicted ester cyclase